eukprot:gb/GECH01014158.1/.p1 GENE.gb/GECH01014158.1/~~gb/GECH01014158.1/.p1  ORF type:complete len:664 (+),score=115.42 gb/GECH01014158.1/:1-1992(+)
MAVTGSVVYVAAQSSASTTNILRRDAEGPWVTVGNPVAGTVSDMLITDSKLYCVGSFLNSVISRNLENDVATVEWNVVGENGSAPSFEKLFNLDRGIVGYTGSSLYEYDSNTEAWNLITGANGLPEAKAISGRIYTFGSTSITLQGPGGETVTGNILSSSDGETWQADLSSGSLVHDLVLDDGDIYYVSSSVETSTFYEVQRQAGTSTSQGFFRSSQAPKLYWNSDDSNLYIFNGVMSFLPSANSDEERPLAGVAMRRGERDFVPAFGGGFSGGSAQQMFAGDSAMYFRGNMDRAYNLFANGMAGYDTKGKRWVDFGRGPDYSQGSINTVYVTQTGSNPSLIVGGSFNRIGGQKLMAIGQVNITAKSMRQLGDGLSTSGGIGNGGQPGFVSAIQVVNDDIYAGGLFDRSGNVPLQNFARFRAETGAWEDVLGGVNGAIATMHSHGPHIVLGGSFSRAGTLNVASIVRYDVGRNEYVPLGSGVVGTVSDVISDGDDIIACGDFSSAGGRHVENIAVWKSGHWEPLECDNDVNDICSLNSACREVKFHSGDLYVRTANNLYRHNGDDLVDLSTSSGSDFSASSGKMLVSSPEDSGRLWTGGVSLTAHFAPHNYLGEFDPDSRNWIHATTGGFDTAPSTMSGAGHVIGFSAVLTVVMTMLSMFVMM